MTESEWKTRKTRIDSRLRAVAPAWEIIRYREGLNPGALTCHAVEEFPTTHGPADYALFVNGRWLGIIEAKKVGVGPQNVLEQARRYSRGATEGVENWGGFRVPFLYATNGEVIWSSDERLPDVLSSPASNLPSPHALEDRFSRDVAAAAARLKGTPLHHIERIRPYQERCISTVESRLVSGQRDLLVAMATGTGKTFLTVAQIFRLLESRFARRILFLVDRKALAAQAVREFNAFTTPNKFKFTQEYEVFSQRFQREDFGDDEPFDPKILPNDYLTAPRATHTFVYVCTIQRLARTVFGAQYSFPQSGEDAERDDDADKLDIPPHAFDVIIADECHRGYSAQELGIWRATLNHFDAVKIGLTATPAAHTVAVFGSPVFRYGVDEAIRDGWLVDWDAVAIRSEVRLKGVFLREGDGIIQVDTDTGAQQLDLLEDERTFAAGEIEKAVTAPQSNERILEEIARHAAEHEEKTGRFPKTLIFAANDIPHTSHADMKERFSEDVLRRAHARLGHQPLADVISLVKNAAAGESPLLTAEERVAAAVTRLEAKLTLTADQLKWLGYIREHLLTSLSLAADDFDEQPIFANRGGLARAKKLFGKDLPAVITRINEAVAA